MLEASSGIALWSTCSVGQSGPTRNQGTVAAMLQRLVVELLVARYGIARPHSEL